MLMTEETKKKLLSSVEDRLNRLTTEVDRLNKTYATLTLSQKFIDKEGLDVNFTGIKKLLDYRLFIGILTLDLCTAMLIYLRAKFQYEGIYSSRQIIVIISEGYKKIYNFVQENEQGDLIKKNRNNSFWIKEIGYIITNELPQYQDSYNRLTEQLDNYLSINFNVLKSQRDLSIHYDKEPIKVYDMISKINIEETFNKLSPFLNILNEMFVFTSELNEGFLEKTETEKINTDKTIDEMANNLEKLNNGKNGELISEFQKKILSFKNLFN